MPGNLLFSTTPLDTASCMEKLLQSRNFIVNEIQSIGILSHEKENKIITYIYIMALKPNSKSKYNNLQYDRVFK